MLFVNAKINEWISVWIVQKAVCFISSWPCVWTWEHSWQDKSSERTLRENVAINQKNNKKTPLCNAEWKVMFTHLWMHQRICVKVAMTTFGLMLDSLMDTVVNLCVVFFKIFLFFKTWMMTYNQNRILPWLKEKKKKKSYLTTFR